MLQSFSRTGLWAFLAAVILLAALSKANAQVMPPLKLRGPPPMPPMGGMAPQPLLPPRQDYAPAIMNNGSLQTTQNPNANLPNQARFIYIAAMPLGDRLGNNGVFYDTNLLPNIGLFQGGQNLFNMQNQQNNQLLNNLANNNNNNNNNNFNPFNPFFNAARMARQQMLTGIYAGYMNQMQQATMMQGGFLSASYMMQMQQALMMYGDPSGFGWFNPNPAGVAVGFGSLGGITPPMNNQGFGAGFPNMGGGF
jgi:hypothetical protein